MTARLLNTRLESGLRSLFVLDAAGRAALDLQRLLWFDYALVNSHDLGGPPSLHPRTPGRTQQLLVRRRLVQDGLDLLRSRELIERRFQSAGIGFRATPSGRYVAGQFASDYADRLRKRARWIAETLQPMSDIRLRSLFADKADPFADELLLVSRFGTPV